MLPGGVLAGGLAQALQFRLGGLGGGEFLQMLGQPVFIGHKEGLAQNAQARLGVVQRPGVNHRIGGLGRRLATFPAQLGRPGQPALAGRVTAQRIGRSRQVRKFRPERAKWGHGGLHHAGVVGQHELGAPAQGGGEGLLRLRAAVFGGHRRVVGAQRGVRRHRGLERAPEGGHGFVVTFQQLVVPRQAELLQHGQRRSAQECGKPAVEGADLHRPVGGEHGSVQIL